MTKDKTGDKKTTISLALTTFTKASGWIVAPVIGAVFLGKYLDREFNLAPFLFIGTMSLAFAVSMYGILRELKIYLKTIETTNGNNSDNNTGK